MTTYRDRRTTLHKTALALGRPDELAVAKACYASNPGALLLDDISAMIPVEQTLELFRIANSGPLPLAQMPGFESLFAFLVELSRKKVSWLVLDARPR